MQKWEYRFFDALASKEEISIYLNELGQQGWLVIQLIPEARLILACRPFNVKQEFKGAQALVRSDGKVDYLIGTNEEENE